MEADWEIEVGGATPIIDALWTGFIDLRRQPERVGEIAEAASFPALSRLLLCLNGVRSPLWTSKCDLWEPDAAELAIGGAVADGPRAGLACYIDMLPHEGMVFAHWQQAEAFCREWVTKLAMKSPAQGSTSLGALPENRVDLIVREAIAGEAEEFGITAYIGATGQDKTAATEALAIALADFADAIPTDAPPAKEA